jgi:DNA mismatch repair protein MutS
VKEWQGEVVFLHEVAPGSADRSYGIHVARLAGLPEAVLRRAAEVLHRLEEGEARSAPAQLAEDLPLFAAARRPAGDTPAHTSAEVEQLLATVDPDALSPRDALDLIYRLKKCLVESGPTAHIRS